MCAGGVSDPVPPGFIVAANDVCCNTQQFVCQLRLPWLLLLLNDSVAGLPRLQAYVAHGDHPAVNMQTPVQPGSRQHMAACSQTLGNVRGNDCLAGIGRAAPPGGGRAGSHVWKLLPTAPA